MPAKSKRQFKKMQELHKQGKISAEQLKDFTHGVDYHSLPERIVKKPVAKWPSRRKSKSK